MGAEMTTRRKLQLWNKRKTKTNAKSHTLSREQGPSFCAAGQKTTQKTKCVMQGLEGGPRGRHAPSSHVEGLRGRRKLGRASNEATVTLDQSGDALAEVDGCKECC